MKKALLVLMSSGVLFATWGGCLGWKWWEGAAWFGKNVTDILDSIGVLTG